MSNIDDLVERLASEAATVQSAPHPLMLSVKWAGWALAYIAVALMLSGLRPDLIHKLHEPLFLAEVAVLAAMFMAASISAATLSFPDMHQMHRVALSPLLAFVVLLFTLYMAWRADIPPALLPQHSFECTLSITVLAVLPAIWMLTQMRKFASTHQRMAGCVAMLAAFSVGALWLRLYEQNDSILHVIEWHYLPMLAFSAAGLWLGKCTLKW
jgi:hypothetical protein